MKNTKILTTAMILLLAGSAMAEDAKTAQNPVKKDNPPKTLLDIKEADFSGYLGVTTSYSKIGEANSCLTGGKGGVIINDNFVLGLGGTGLTYPSGREKISGRDYTGEFNSVGFGYGGFLMEYYLNPKDLIVFSGGTLIGAGGMTLYHRNDNDDGSDDNNHGDKFFVIEPELNVFVNITRFCRIGIGASYRLTNGIKTAEFADRDFSGPSANITAQFGWF